MLGNLALFIPFGALGMLALVPSRPPGARFVVLFLFAILVAAGVQVLQLFLPGRDAALGDVVWNLGGLTLGALLVWPASVRARLLGYAGSNLPLVPLGLLLCWLGSETAPFVPSADLQALKDSVRPLFAAPEILSAEFLRAYVSWLVACYLVERLWPGRSVGLWVLWTAIGVVLSKILIVQNAVSSGYVLALVLALLTWRLYLRAARRQLLVLLASTVALIAVVALEPFTVNAEARVFSWIPFSGALTGSMVTNVKALTGKLFLLGSLLCLLEAAGCRLAVATILAVLFTAALEFAQVWIGSHTPEITDPLMVLCLGTAMAVLRRESAPQPVTLQGAAPPGRRDAPVASAGSREMIVHAAAARRIPRTQAVFIALAGCVLATLAMQTVLGLPQVPYNVRELFGGEDSWWRLFIFSLAGLSVGLGGAAVGQLVASGGRVVWVLPAGTFLVCLVTYLLLVSSVSAESIWDITGSSNTYWFVMNRGSWGEAGIWLYEAIGSRALIQAVERYVRFTALLGQAVLWIAILSAIYFRLVGPSRAVSVSTARVALSVAIPCLLAAAPWLVLFNLVAFDFSSTDNLNELIGGRGHILYWLLILLPTDALVVLHVFRRRDIIGVTAGMLVVALSLPIGWFLFKNGLSPEVTKYGRIFSGVDFLLGPDREELLTEAVLMIRWFGVQCAAVGALALGMQVVPDPAETAPLRTKR